ncbi:MAG: hypothetical protein V3S65_05045, partial [Candidatus Aminicenantaceae bacterium]
TCSPEYVSHVRSAVETVSNTLISEVGIITDTVKEIQLKLPDGTKRQINPLGWDHFKLKGGENV